MSYESNWGFREPSDEFGNIVPCNDFGNEIKTKGNNDFIVELQLCQKIKGLVSSLDDNLSEKFSAFHIVSDFEPISSRMVSHYIMENHPGMLAYPSTGEKDVIVFCISDLKITDGDLRSTITAIQKKFGLDVTYSDTCNPNIDLSNLSLATEETDMLTIESESDILIECILSSIYYHMLASGAWFTWSTDDQKKGVLAKVSEDGNTFVDVVALKDCTMDSYRGVLALRLQTICCRVNKTILSELIDEDSEEHDVSEPKPLSTAQMTMIFLPTGEEVTVSTFHSYKGALTTSSEESMKTTTGELHSDKKKSYNSQKKLSCPVLLDDSISLTKLDIKNRLRGYSLFLPDSKEKCIEYWQLGYGIKLRSDVSSCDDNKKGYHMTEVKMELGDHRIVPTQLLASSFAEVTSRTRRLAHSTASAFVAHLRRLTIFESVSDPMQLQPVGVLKPLENLIGADCSSRPLVGRLQSALSLRNNANGSGITDAILNPEKASQRCFTTPRISSTVIGETCNDTVQLSSSSVSKSTSEYNDYTKPKYQHTGNIKPVGIKKKFVMVSSVNSNNHSNKSNDTNSSNPTTSMSCTGSKIIPNLKKVVDVAPSRGSITQSVDLPVSIKCKSKKLVPATAPIIPKLSPAKKRTKKDASHLPVTIFPQNVALEAASLPSITSSHKHHNVTGIGLKGNKKCILKRGLAQMAEPKQGLGLALDSIACDNGKKNKTVTDTSIKLPATNKASKTEENSDYSLSLGSTSDHEEDDLFFQE